MKKFSLIETALFLKGIPLFEELDLDLVVAIADKMHQTIYDENETVFERGQKAIQLYFIATGSVHIIDKNRIVKTLISKDFFGDEALFNENQREYSAKCAKDTLLLTVTKTNLLTIISECPIVAISLLNKYSKALPCRFL